MSGKKLKSVLGKNGAGRPCLAIDPARQGRPRLFATILILISFIPPTQAETPARTHKLEIYSDGRLFKSIEEYKRYELEAWDNNNKEKSAFKTSTKTTGTLKATDDPVPTQPLPKKLSYKELKAMADEPISLAEMQKSANEIFRKKKDIVPFILNPAKVKTITLPPPTSASLKASDQPDDNSHIDPSSKNLKDNHS